MADTRALPRCQGLGFWYHDGYGTGYWTAIAVNDEDNEYSVGDRMTLEEFRQVVTIVQCAERAYKPKIDERFNVPLCRGCFYAAAREWQRLNVEAGLCACGVDCMPGIQECRECNARSRRNAARIANRKRTETRAAKAKAAAEAETKHARDEKQRRRKERFEALTHERVHRAFADTNGDRPKAERALGLERGELSTWMARTANRDVAWKFKPRSKREAAMESARHRWPQGGTASGSPPAAQNG